MIKQIQLRGISRTPSDRMSEDGGLSESLNMYLDTAESAPAFIPQDVTSKLGLPADLQAERVFIHKTANYENYIVVQGNRVVAYTPGIEDEEPLLVSELNEKEEVESFSSIGNTIIISTSQRALYSLYSKRSYSFLGENIPFPTIEIFDVQTPIVHQEEFDYGPFMRQGALHSYKIDLVYPEDLYSEEGAQAVRGLINVDEGGFDDNIRKPVFDFDKKLWNDIDTEGQNKNENVRQVFDAIKTKYKEMLAHNEELGIMCNPVWAVYAVRLYDGSLRVSMPFLISGGIETPVDIFSEGEYNVGLGIYYIRLNHYYRIGLKLYDYSEENLQQWKDIIKGVAVYISEDINPLDWKSIQIEHQEQNLEGDPDFLKRSKFVISGYSGKYEEFAASCSAFNKIAEFSIDASYYPTTIPSIDEIRSDYIIDMKGKTKMADRTNQLLSDEEYSFNNDIFYGKTTTFNNRLIYTNAKEIIDSGARWLLGQRFNSHIPRPRFTSNVFDTAIEYYPSWWKENPFPEQDEITEDSYEFVYHISGVTSNNVVYGQTINGIKFTPIYGRYQYKPVVFLLAVFRNSACSGVEIWRNEEGTSFPITSHVGIPKTTMAYGGPLVWELSGNLTQKPVEDKEIDISNKILVSIVDNPFQIPNEGIFTFQSKVIGVAIATTALSQGQFGQFPLYVFTEDGIWAMETAADGSFISQKPLSREVCINPDSITSIDNAVVFVTAKGVMMIQGSQVMNISPYMNGKHFVPSKEIQDLISNQEGFCNLVSAISDEDSFMSFIKEAQVAYDYPGQRLIFINPSERNMQYIYKIDTQTWHKSMFEGLYLYRPLNSFPECLVQTEPTNKDTILIHFSSSSIKNKASMIMKFYERMNGKIGLKEAKGFIEGEVDLPIELQPIFQPILTDLAKEYSFAFALSKVKVVEGSTKVVSLTSILDDSIDQRTAKGVIITRPLDLGESDVYKTITDVRIRGQFAKGAVKFILLGSNNGNDFHIINTLRGKAWKLFRLVLLTDLQPTERISWIDVMYETKFKNRLR